MTKTPLRGSFVTALAALAMSATTFAADTYKVDTVHSSVTFRIKHMNVSYAYGRFNDITGTFTLDDADAKKSKFEFEVKVDSIDTNNRERDKHLKTPEFFDAKEYPTIKFVSKSVKAGENGALEVTGDMTLHGKTKEITVKIDKTGAGKGRGGEALAGIECLFSVKRSEYGMDKMIPNIGDEVKLAVSIEGAAEKAGK